MEYEEIKKSIQNLIAEEKYYEAIRLCNEAIEFDQNQAELYAYRGYIKDLLGQTIEGIDDFAKAMQLDPNNCDFYIASGQDKLRLNNFEEAVKDFDKAIELDSNDARAFFYRGEANQKLNKYEDSIEDFGRAINLDSYYVDAYLERAFSKASLALSDKINGFFTKSAAELDNYDYLVNQTLDKDKLSLLNEALEDFSRVIELDKYNSSAYYFSGKINYCLRNYSLAKENFEKVVPYSPDEFVDTEDFVTAIQQKEGFDKNDSCKNDESSAKHEKDEKFEIEEFIKNILEEERKSVPNDLNKEIKVYLLKTTEKIIRMANEGMSNDSEIEFSLADREFFLLVFAQWTFRKIVDLAYSKIPSGSWASIVQQISFEIYEAIRKSIINGSTQDETLQNVENCVEKAYKECLKNL